MTAKELKRIFSKGECLSLDVMRLYNDGKLNKKSMHEVEKHLLECNLCSGAVDGLNTKRIADVNKLSAHIQRRLAVYMNTPPPVTFFQRFGLYIIGATILMLAGGTWLYISQTHKRLEPEISDSARVKSEKKTSDLQLPANTSVIPEHEQNQTDENITAVVEKTAAVNSTTPSSELQFPAPSNSNSVGNALPNPDHSSPITSSNAGDGSTTGPTTRSASTNQFLRVKSVQVYPPVTHTSGSARKESKDGQLGRTSSSSASFELDDMPSYPGGNEALRNFIITNFKPTSLDKSKLTRFATGVLFVVNSKTGEVSAPELSFSISPEVDKELLRVIGTIPNWNPGKKRGEVDIMIGITFE